MIYLTDNNKNKGVTYYGYPFIFSILNFLFLSVKYSTEYPLKEAKYIITYITYPLITKDDVGKSFIFYIY